MTDSAVAAADRPRIETLDVLRGLALLGILAVNAPFFAMPWAWTVDIVTHAPVTPWDIAAWWTVATFFEGKFVSLFSMLFGVSLYLVGRERSDLQAGSRLRRRLSWLLLFGVIHGAAVWYGDILVTYALSGLLVLLMRSWRARTLIAVGVVMLTLFAALGLTVAIVDAAATPGDGTAAFIAREAARALAGFGGDFTQSLTANATTWLLYLGVSALPSLMFVVPLMLLGLGLFKAGVFTDEAPPAVYRALAAIGLSYLAVLGVLNAVEIQAEHRGLAGGLAGGVNDGLAPFASLGYLALIVPAVSRGGLRPLAAMLAPVGRMAFTNYLTQSLLMTAIFYGGRGPGLFGEVERAAQLAIVAAVWALQIAWSRWWLTRFAYGPFEWLWRSLTEGRRVPIRHVGLASETTRAGASLR